MTKDFIWGVQYKSQRGNVTRGLLTLYFNKQFRLEKTLPLQISITLRKNTDIKKKKIKLVS